MHPPIDLDRLVGEWWEVAGTQQALELESELEREVTEEHVLAGVVASAVAVKRHLKDVVFWLPERSEWAAVHLTYVEESDPRWPSTVVSADWETLLSELS